MVNRLSFAWRHRSLRKFLELVSMFIREDLPTFDLPMKANSGLSGAGHFVTSA
jgi:hypothetical protein